VADKNPLTRRRTRKPMGRASVARRPRISAMAVPRVGDILRGEPNIIQGAAAGTIDLLRRATEALNGETVAAGGRRFDYPGRRNVKARTQTIGKPGTFKAGVPLNPAAVADRRDPKYRTKTSGALTVKRAPAQSRSGASSSTSAPRAMAPLGRRRTGTRPSAR
jgi:hypothetical protein